MHFLWRFLLFLVWFGHPYLVFSDNQCRDIFKYRETVIPEFPLQSINAGQDSVGYDYAYYKALRDAKIDTSKNFSKLKTSEKKQVLKSLFDELSTFVPVIVAPNGQYFAIDGHHDMFALSHLMGKKSKVRIPVVVVRDFSKENISEEQFQSIVQKNGWIYSKIAKSVLEQPLSIFDLRNSVERSVVGMAFIKIAKKKGIPMKGKYFVPFIQFLIADFLVDKNIFSFSSVYSKDDVDKVVDLIETNKYLRTFLRENLAEDVPKDIEEFLDDSSR